jgi:hypothetical protein
MAGIDWSLLETIFAKDGFPSPAEKSSAARAICPPAAFHFLQTRETYNFFAGFIEKTSAYLTKRRKKDKT